MFFLYLVSLCALVFFFLRLQSGGRGGAVGGRLIKEEPAAACSQPFWRKAFNTAARQRSKPLSRHWEGDSITILLEPPCLKPSQKKKERKDLRITRDQNGQTERSSSWWRIKWRRSSRVQMHAGVKESSEERGKVFRPQQQQKSNWKIESGEDTRVRCRSSSRRECRLDERREKKLQWSSSGNLKNTDGTFESFLLKHTGRWCKVCLE